MINWIENNCSIFLLKKGSERMKWNEKLLDAKHSKTKQKQIKEKEACPHTKHTWAVWNTLPQDVVALMHYWSSRSSWVSLLQEGPAGTIKYKRLSLFALTLAFSVISDTLEICRWILNLKETFPFLTRAGYSYSYIVIVNGLTHS